MDETLSEELADEIVEKLISTKDYIFSSDSNTVSFISTHLCRSFRKHLLKVGEAEI